MKNILKMKKINSTSYIEFSSPELLFLGESGQPYRGTLYIQYYCMNETLDLISLKKYITSLRSKIIILEEVANIIYCDISKVMNSKDLCVTVKTSPRGGISSTIQHGNINIVPKAKPIFFGVGV